MRKQRRQGKKGPWASLLEGFAAIQLLDNTNIYAVIFSECVSNIFKEGMWFKALTPYMLILTSGNPVAVGSMTTLNGVTRAAVGVVAGRLLINKLGIDSVWIATGFFGTFGILVNVLCLCRQSVEAAYVLSFTWAVYNGLWNSCLETSWARSVMPSKREDVNGARQVLNKLTTAFGPLFSAGLFLYFGNTWDGDIVQCVMLIGTALTSMPVLMSFSFTKSQEVEQEVSLLDVEHIVFPRAPQEVQDVAESVTIECGDLKKRDFEANDMGLVTLTYPLGKASKVGKWHSRVRILTTDLQETCFILGKQYNASFRKVPNDERVCVIHFEDVSAAPVRVWLESLSAFLRQDALRSVNRSVSKLRFRLYPDLSGTPDRISFMNLAVRLAKLEKLMPAAFGRTESKNAELEAALLASSKESDGQEAREESQAKMRRASRPNLFTANIIVVCDVLNALACGLSLKFVDIFLKEDYGVSPAGVFMVAFAQNIAGAWFTPLAKSLLNFARERGYRAKLVVVFFWSLALCFLGLVCIPGVPLGLVVMSIVLMQSLNSCTKAYNRAVLVKSLTYEKISTYMAWDSLNKANQGGIAIFGSQLIVVGGYRAAFAGTFFILLLRLLVYMSYTLRKGTVFKGSTKRAWAEETITWTDMETQDVSMRPNLDGIAESQLFNSNEGAPEKPKEERIEVLSRDFVRDFDYDQRGEDTGASKESEQDEDMDDRDSPVSASSRRNLEDTRVSASASPHSTRTGGASVSRTAVGKVTSGKGSRPRSNRLSSAS